MRCFLLDNSCHRGAEARKINCFGKKGGHRGKETVKNYPYEYRINFATGNRPDIGVGIEVHKELGAGFLEIVYKDALEYELRERGYSFQREEEYQIPIRRLS